MRAISQLSRPGNHRHILLHFHRCASKKNFNHGTPDLYFTFFGYNNPTSHFPCLFSRISMGNAGGVIPGEQESSKNFLLLAQREYQLGGCGSQGACTSIPLPMKYTAHVQGAQEALLSGGGQSDVNKALKLCRVRMTQESHAIPRSC